jgi:hypothetical protein
MIAVLLLMASVVLIFSLRPARMQDSGSSFGTLNVATNFTDLTFSTSPDGPAMTYFPIGTTQIYARWSYSNVPPEALLHRDWYRDGLLDIQRESAWSWGSSGYLNSISIYDFTQGLTPGYYTVVIYLTPGAFYPAAQVVGDFVIAGLPPTVVPPSASSAFSLLTVSASAAGPDTFEFPTGTPLIAVRWNYANIPIGAVMVREWYFNGLLFKTVQEPWSANWGSSGRLTHVSLYDYERGLDSGDYTLKIYLRDNPNVRAETAFRIGSSLSGQAYFSSLTFSASANGPETLLFPAGTTQVFARWNYREVPANAIVVRRWYRNGVLWLTREEPWRYGREGWLNSISVYDFVNGLLPGGYYVEFELKGYPESLLRGSFNIQ